MPSILTELDKETVRRNVPRPANKILAVAVARLYIAYPDPQRWTFTGLQGAAVICNDFVGRTFWLKLVDVSVGSRRSFLLPSSLSQTAFTEIFFSVANLKPSNRGVIWDQGKISSDLTGSTPMKSSSLQPILEEQPKWSVLAEVLDEIERDAHLNPTTVDESNNIVLVMCSDQRTCRQLREYLSTMHTGAHAEFEPRPEEEDETSQEKPSAQVVMRRNLRSYLNWKTAFSNASKNLSAAADAESLKGSNAQPSTTTSSTYHSRAPPNKRRRVRGNATFPTARAHAPNDSVQVEIELPEQVSSLLEEIKHTEADEPPAMEEITIDDLDDMEDYYELYDMSDLVMIHPYDGDMDEQILEEVRPRYIVMYEPDAAFIRRVEVYRSSHVGRSVRVYFMYYGGSVEEQRYLSAVRKEKDSFTKLIKEKSVSLRQNCSEKKVNVL